MANDSGFRPSDLLDCESEVKQDAFPQIGRPQPSQPCWAVGLLPADADDSSSSSSCTEEPYSRSYFYVGGGYVDNGADQHIYRDQMYVERLRPAKGVTQNTPLVLIHGQAQTGSVSLKDCAEKLEAFRAHPVIRRGVTSKVCRLLVPFRALCPIRLCNKPTSPGPVAAAANASLPAELPKQAPTAAVVGRRDSSSKGSTSTLSTRRSAAARRGSRARGRRVRRRTLPRSSRSASPP